MGLQRAQGGLENPPVTLVRLAITDWIGAALGALGTLMALFVRESTGVAQRVDTNLLNAAIVIGSGDFLSYDGKPSRRRADKDQYGYNALHRLYEAADGWLYLVAEAEKDWITLCDALGVSQLAIDARFRTEEIRRRNDALLASELARAVKRFGLTELSDRLKRAGIPHSPVVYGYVPSFPSNPHALANDMVVEYGSPPAGPMTYLGNSVLLGDTAPVRGRATPFLGQHNREILDELGYSSAEVEELHRKEVVRTEEPQ
jgi:crotonobetainyl-CoA:carnitine CoA-transferase CaiB-like acyl-CoA transferase